jgi:hypothetical protein
MYGVMMNGPTIVFRQIAYEELLKDIDKGLQELINAGVDQVIIDRVIGAQIDNLQRIVAIWLLSLEAPDKDDPMANLVKICNMLGRIIKEDLP